MLDLLDPSCGSAAPVDGQDYEWLNEGKINPIRLRDQLVVAYGPGVRAERCCDRGQEKLHVNFGLSSISQPVLPRFDFYHIWFSSFIKPKALKLCATGPPPRLVAIGSVDVYSKPLIPVDNDQFEELNHQVTSKGLK
nr:unnamed protein product [Spirometra erinaceieuropaei]